MEYVNILTGKCTNIVVNPPIEFKYECDDFQKHAFYCISKNENVMVTAHTGSGKTSVAEFAIAHTIMNKKRVVYTSPTKSLSNEKYGSLREKFKNNQNINIGILTGDNKINPDGNCIIMTAEILRNSLYRLKNVDKNIEKNDPHISTDFVDQIGCVIIDEVHFINDLDRGKVWEETLVLLSPDVQLILLSATISKPEQFAQWIGSIKKKPMNLIPTTKRIVPLRHYMFAGEKLHMICDQNKNYSSDNYLLAKKEYDSMQKIRKLKHKRDANFGLIRDVITYLKKHDLMQTIFFAFSRRKCEEYAAQVTDVLVDYNEYAEIEYLFNKSMHKFEKQYEQLKQYQTVKELLKKGIAFHHSGLLPILKEVIEIIFLRGLIKVLFATETFAVGVNMPTRTVVFIELEKYTNANKRIINPAEYTQMSGRAGRRGIDTNGTVIILPVFEFPDNDVLKNMLLGVAPNIQSKLQIDHQFFLKAIQSETTDIETFLKNSLYNLECNHMMKANKTQLDILSKKLITYNFDKDVLDKFVEYYKFDNNNASTFNGFKLINISKKDTKRYSQLKSEMLRDKKISDLYSKYIEYINSKKEYDHINDEIKIWETQTHTNLENIKKFLQQIGYIDGNTILKKGVIAAQINECNSILLTELIVNGHFKGMTPEEIVGTIAIFIEDTKNDEELSLNDIKATPKIIECINKVNEYIKMYTDIERDIGIHNDWKISYGFVDISYEWVCGKNINDMLTNMESTYVGNFIKNMIKINNITKDMIFLFQIDGNNDVTPILSKIEPLIMKYFVTVNSLYLI